MRGDGGVPVERRGEREMGERGVTTGEGDETWAQGETTKEGSPG